MQYGIVSWSGPRQLSEAEVEVIRRRVERVAPALARMEWRDDGYNPFSQVTLTARRVNLANIGREARATLRFGSVDDIDRADVERWTRAVVDVLDTTIGDVTITACRSYQIIENDCQVVTQADLSCAEAELTPSIKRESRKWCKLEGRVSAPGPAPVLPPALDEQEDRQIARLDLEQRLALDRLQAAIIDYITTYHADPHQLLMQLRGKVIVGNQPSPLVVNHDMDIVLPHYNEIVIEMPAMCKAIYILFLLHPEGIVLKRFADHRAQLEQIYTVVMPNRDEALARESIDNLCSPLSNTLNEYLSKIKRSFRRYVLSADLLEQYVIAGHRGGPFGVHLSPDLVTLPRVFTQ